MSISFFGMNNTQIDRLIATLNDKSASDMDKDFREKNYSMVGHHFTNAKVYIQSKPTMNNFVVKHLFNRGDIVCFWGLPASLKSILALFIAVCVASGKFFTDLKVKQGGVLFISAENNEERDIKRLKAVQRGIRISIGRRKYFPLSFYPREMCRNVCEEFEIMKDFIRANNIKLVIIDTLSALFDDVDPNDSKEVNRLFRMYIYPLVDELNVSVLYTHHSDKKGYDYFGSVKWKGNADINYEVKREHEGEKVSLLADKSRDGETCFDFNVNFMQDKDEQLKTITINKISEAKGHKHQVDVKKGDACKEFICELLKDNELTYSEIVDNCIKSVGASEATAKRTINALYMDKKIFKKHKGGYYIKS